MHCGKCREQLTQTEVEMAGWGRRSRSKAKQSKEKKGDGVKQALNSRVSGPNLTTDPHVVTLTVLTEGHFSAGPTVCWRHGFKISSNFGFSMLQFLALTDLYWRSTFIRPALVAQLPL